MTDWSSALNGTPTVLVGDFNIAPLESDVWNHKALLDVVSHTPVEVETLGRLQAASNWIDLGRQFIAAPTPLYTWWSYRAKDWEASNRGRRLDHIWVTPDLRDRAIAHRIVQPARSWERPSDHIPLITEFAF
jgi:exodeoxyribonuclease-3